MFNTYFSLGGKISREIQFGVDHFVYQAFYLQDVLMFRCLLFLFTFVLEVLEG